jgi:hypothetical protein
MNLKTIHYTRSSVKHIQILFKYYFKFGSRKSSSGQHNKTIKNHYQVNATRL